MQAGSCPICNSTTQSSEVYSPGSAPIWNIRCARCSEYSMYDSAKRDFERALQMEKKEIVHYLSTQDAQDQRSDIALYIEVAKKAADERRMDIPRSIFSHVLCKRKDKREPLTYDILCGILKNNSLPTPAEQANNFIVYLGEHLSSPGDTYGKNMRSCNALSRIAEKLLWQWNSRTLKRLKKTTSSRTRFSMNISFPL
jgi:hypothetical protein